MPFGNCYGPGAIATASAFSVENSNPKEWQWLQPLLRQVPFLLETSIQKKKSCYSNCAFFASYSTCASFGTLATAIALFGNCTLFSLGVDL
mmetsp:Transcript_70321/g.103031  ORF Transcript_70321/g.103031 Transcript_70321/m.103031 type:complete len:91 (-) Transcript_70321:230-502(-)